MKSPLCKCGNLKRSDQQRYCLACHAQYMRENRPKHRDLSSDQRFKANSRSYSNTYQNRGLLIKQPCVICGEIKAEKHHEDYSKPLAVDWICRPCHLEYHAA